MWVSRACVRSVPAGSGPIVSRFPTRLGPEPLCLDERCPPGVLHKPLPRTRHGTLAPKFTAGKHAVQTTLDR